MSRGIINLRNCTGISFALLHALALSYLIYSKELLPPPRPCELSSPDQICLDPWDGFASVIIVAGRSFHLSYETPVLQFLMLADLPAQLAGLLWTYTHLGPFILILSKPMISYLVGMNWLIFGSVQWGLIGMIAGTKLKFTR
jgi:hypothetical protein